MSGCASSTGQEVLPESGAPAAKKAAVTQTGARTQSPFAFISVTRRSFAFRHQGHFNLVLDSEQGWIVVDPMNSVAAAELSRQLLRKAPDKPLALIAYSHYHADHAGGARALLDAFGEDVPIVANRKTPPLYAGKKWAEVIVPPTLLIDPPWSQSFGDLTLELRSVGPNHSTDMLVTYVPEEKLVYVVDFLSNRGVGYRDLPGATLPNYWASQRQVLELPFRHVIFGHGLPGDRQSVIEHIAYWDQLRLETRSALTQGLTEDEAMQKITLDDYRTWTMYDAWFKLNVRAVYRYEKAASAETETRE